MDRTNRQILINPHTSGLTAPKGLLNLGEIAVQHDSTSGASLWIETKADSTSEDTLVRFMNASAVTALVESARTDLQDEIDAINDAVGLPHSSGEFSGRVVWDAIEQIYDELVASAAAATTYVVSGDTEDTEKYLKITDALDEKTSAHTYTISLSGISDDINAVKADVLELSGAVESFSAATVAEFNSAFTAIQGMDKDADAVDGKVVTTISQADGKVTETKADVKDLQLGGYSKDTGATGDIAGTDTINAALSKLENKAAAITIANADGSINITTAATGTDINVNIKTGEKVLAKDGNAGLYTDIKLSSVTPTSTTVKEEFALYATDGSVLGDHIKVYKDSHIVSITYITDTASTHYQNLEYKYIDADGAEQTEYVDISSLVLEAEFASGVGITNHVAHGVVDPATEKDSNNDAFLTVGAEGFKVDGIKDEIVHQISLLDVTDDAAVAGQYVAAIEETDGKVAVKTRADVSKAPLNDYAKGTDATAVAATDTVNQAISKLENQIDKAKAAATTKVVEGTENAHMEITSAQSQADSSMTYTITLTDVASESALTAEIAARKAVDGQNGDTYVANSGSKHISGATNLNDADVKLNAAIVALEDALDNLDYTDSAKTGQYVTKVDETNGLISVERANVSEALLNNYSKGTDATTVAATDTINQAVSKLENQIDVEIAARKAVDGQDGQTYTANTTAKYISSATSLNDADVKLDSAVAAITNSAVTAAEFNAVANKNTTEYGSNAGIEVVANGESKKIVLDLSLLKIDCGEY